MLVPAAVPAACTPGANSNAAVTQNAIFSAVKARRNVFKQVVSGVGLRPSGQDV